MDWIMLLVQFAIFLDSAQKGHMTLLLFHSMMSTSVLVHLARHHTLLSVCSAGLRNQTREQDMHVVMQMEVDQIAAGDHGWGLGERAADVVHELLDKRDQHTRDWWMWEVDRRDEIGGRGLMVKNVCCGPKSHLHHTLSHPDWLDHPMILLIDVIFDLRIYRRCFTVFLL